MTTERTLNGPIDRKDTEKKYTNVCILLHGLAKAGKGMTTQELSEQLRAHSVGNQFYRSGTDCGVLTKKWDMRNSRNVSIYSWNIDEYPDVPTIQFVENTIVKEMRNKLRTSNLKKLEVTNQINLELQRNAELKEKPKTHLDTIQTIFLSKETLRALDGFKIADSVEYVEINGIRLFPDVLYLDEQEDVINLNFTAQTVVVSTMTVKTKEFNGITIHQKDSVDIQGTYFALEINKLLD